MVSNYRDIELYCLPTDIPKHIFIVDDGLF